MLVCICISMYVSVGQIFHLASTDYVEIWHVHLVGVAIKFYNFIEKKSNGDSEIADSFCLWNDSLFELLHRGLQEDTLRD